MGNVGTYFDVLEDSTFEDTGATGVESAAFAAGQKPVARKTAAIEASQPQYSLEFMNTLSQYDVQGRFAPVESQPAAATFVFDNLPFDIASIEPGNLEWGQYIMMIIRAIRDRQEYMSDGGINNVVLNGADAALELGGGDDRVYLAARGESVNDFDNVEVNGGGGSDSLYLYRDARRFGTDREISGEGFTVNLDAANDFGSHGGQVQLNGIENVFGSNHADIITGNGSGNLLSGRGGDDILSGEAGGDTLLGGDGNDILDGGAGDDTLDGGAGKDNISGGAGKDDISGGADNDTLQGGDGDDTLKGGDGDDTVNGGQGDDLVNGNGGKDTLKGGAGDDTVDGGEGDDILAGGAGADKLTGGAGADRFEYSLLSDSPDGADDRDVIDDFDAAADMFDFTDLTDDPDAEATALTFIGTAAFSNTKGQIRYEQKNLAGTDNDYTLVQIDDDGDGTVDFEIELSGLHTLAAGDFDL